MVSAAKRPTSRLFFFFNDTATTEIYTLSLHDALPIYQAENERAGCAARGRDERAHVLRRRLVRLRRRRSEEHTSELQSLAYLVCRLLLEKKKTKHATLLRLSECYASVAG